MTYTVSGTQLRRLTDKVVGLRKSTLIENLVKVNRMGKESSVEHY